MQDIEDHVRESAPISLAASVRCLASAVTICRSLRTGLWPEGLSQHLASALPSGEADRHLLAARPVRRSPRISDDLVGGSRGRIRARGRPARMPSAFGQVACFVDGARSIARSARSGRGPRPACSRMAFGRRKQMRIGNLQPERVTNLQNRRVAEFAVVLTTAQARHPHLGQIVQFELRWVVKHPSSPPDRKMNRPVRTVSC